jgi:hypothetical protein
MSDIIDLKKKIKDVENLKKLVNLAETEFKKKFNKLEITDLINFINQLNFTKIYNKDIDIVNSDIVSTYKKIVMKPKNFDLQEYFKQQINEKSNINLKKYESFQNKESLENPNDSELVRTLIQMMPNLNTENDKINFTKILNYESLLRDSNILLDSRYQNLSNNDLTKIQFTIMNNSKIKVPGSGIITSIAPMRDILEIEIFPFSIPYSANADNYYKKITMSILELSSVSVDSYENCQFHFMFIATKNKNLIDLTPINPIFRFFKPITKLADFTLRFGTPLTPIVFDKDRLYATINYGSSPCVLTFNENHNLISGDLIYINDFTTLNPAQDLNIINVFNDNNGYLCTRISNDEISINVDATKVLFPDPNLSINIYFGSKRILLPLRLRYMYNTLE